MTKFSHKNRGYISIISKNMDYIGYFDIFIFFKYCNVCQPWTNNQRGLAHYFCWDAGSWREAEPQQESVSCAGVRRRAFQTTTETPVHQCTDTQQHQFNNHIPRARFTKYLTIYHKIILSLSQDRLMTVTYNVPSSFVGISQVILQTLSQTILRSCMWIEPLKIFAFLVRCFVN